jgi:histone H3/H4
MTTAALISERAFDDALASLRISAPATARAAADARAALGQVTYRFARRLLDALRIVSSHRTLQPEHVRNLASLSNLLALPISRVAPAPGALRTGSLVMRGGSAAAVMRGGSGAVGSTVLPAAYFGDAETAFSAENATSFTPSFPDVPGGGDTVRFGLDASSAFGPDNAQATLLGGGTKPWLRDDAVDAIIREYRARSARDLRVSEAARGLIRTIVEANAEAVLRAAARSKGAKRKAVTASAIARAADATRLSL